MHHPDLIRRTLRRRTLLKLAATLPFTSAPALAADVFPDRPVRLVVPFAPGGPTDLMARVVAKHLQDAWNQPVIVDNKPGGGGVIGMGEVLKQPADGYTLAFPSILAVTNPALMPSYPFDTAREFTGVTVIGFIPHALVVRPDFPARSVADLVAMAKAAPGTLTYGSSGNGTSAHLAAAVFADRAGIRMIHVPYRGAGPAMQDLLGGQIQLMFLDLPTALPQIQAGKLRAIAVAPQQRTALLPGVPTIAEQGYLGYDIHGWYGILVRSATPPGVVATLHAALKRVLDRQDVRDTFVAQGIAPGGMPQAEFDALFRSDLLQWKRTITQLKITLQ